MKKLSILIPVYNEQATITILLQAIARVQLAYALEKELIIVDDASTDDTVARVQAFRREHPHLDIRLFRHEVNRGKGGCIHTAIRHASGDAILVQDADLEYDPADYNALLQPMMERGADVVYGSRFVGGRPHRILFFWHSIGNKILTFFSNMVTNLNLTDMENGYKLFRADLLKSLQLKEERFGFEPEVTARIARIPGIRIYEIGISYYGRTYEEGKKINWRDGLRAVYAIIKYNLLTRDKTLQPTDRLFHYKRSPAYLLLLLFFLAGLVLIFTAGGTGDEGDSVMHYLYARHSWENGAFFFNHWAKPVFVLLASPFAQGGMEGMKFFNLLVSTLTLFLSFRTALLLKVPYPWLVPLCMVFAPWLMIVTLSGLTEPLFALGLIGGIYLLLKEKWLAAALTLSFLPFVRSEGLVILCVILVYLAIKKKYFFIPLLLTGHVVYALAGYPYHKDLLWVFNTMSYAVLSSAYGQGEWNHFIKNTREVIGMVVYFFLALGLVYGAIQWGRRVIHRHREAIGDEELWLVYGMFVTYLLAHTAFWALGIFNSFGLLRVMIGVLPLIGLIAARGFNFLASFSRSELYKPAVYFALVLIMAYPFLGRRFSYNWQRDFSLKADQQAEQQLAAFVQQQYPDYKNRLFFYEACYVSVALGMNYFDSSEHRRLRGAFEENRFPPGSFIVWDDWFAPMEGGVEASRLDGDPRFAFIRSFEQKDVWGQTRSARLYQVR